MQEVEEEEGGEGGGDVNANERLFECFPFL